MLAPDGRELYGGRDGKWGGTALIDNGDRKTGQGQRAAWTDWMALEEETVGHGGKTGVMSVTRTRDRVGGGKERVWVIGVWGDWTGTMCLRGSGW